MSTVNLLSFLFRILFPLLSIYNEPWYFAACVFRLRVQNITPSEVNPDGLAELSAEGVTEGSHHLDVELRGAPLAHGFLVILNFCKFKG